jgi:hypothetical protein
VRVPRRGRRGPHRLLPPAVRRLRKLADSGQVRSGARTLMWPSDRWSCESLDVWRPAGARRSVGFEIGPQRDRSGSPGGCQCRREGCSAGCGSS